MVFQTTTKVIKKTLKVVKDTLDVFFKIHGKLDTNYPAPKIAIDYQPY